MSSLLLLIPWRPPTVSYTNTIQHRTIPCQPVPARLSLRRHTARHPPHSIILIRHILIFISSARGQRLPLELRETRQTLFLLILFPDLFIPNRVHTHIVHSARTSGISVRRVLAP